MSQALLGSKTAALYRIVLRNKLKGVKLCSLSILIQINILIAQTRVSSLQQQTFANARMTNRYQGYPGATGVEQVFC